MSKFFLLLSVIIFLVSCKKSTTSIPADNGKYFTKAYLTHFDKFRIYTRDGEIANSSLAQTYGTEFGSYFFPNAHSFLEPDYLKFEYINDDSIINLGTRLPVTAVRKNIDMYDTYSSRFTTRIYDTIALYPHILKYKTSQLKTSGGVTYLEMESPVYILKRINDTLFFPMVKYVFTSRRPSIFFFGQDEFNNVFSSDGVSKLGLYDTLVVQSFDLAMKKSL